MLEVYRGFWTITLAVVAVQTVAMPSHEDEHHSHSHRHHNHWNKQETKSGRGTTHEWQETQYMYPFGVYRQYHDNDGKEPKVQGHGSAIDTSFLENQGRSWLLVAKATSVNNENLLGHPETTFWVTLSLVLVLWAVFTISCIICQRGKRPEERLDLGELEDDNEFQENGIPFMSSIPGDNEKNFTRNLLLSPPACLNMSDMLYNILKTSSRKSSGEELTEQTTDTGIAEILFENENEHRGGVLPVVSSSKHESSLLEDTGMDQKNSEKSEMPVAVATRDNKWTLIWLQLHQQLDTKEFLKIDDTTLYNKTSKDGRNAYPYRVDGWCKSILAWPLNTPWREQLQRVNVSNVGGITTQSYTGWRHDEIPMQWEMC